MEPVQKCEMRRRSGEAGGPSPQSPGGVDCGVAVSNEQRASTPTAGPQETTVPTMALERWENEGGHVLTGNQQARGEIGHRAPAYSHS